MGQGPYLAGYEYVDTTPISYWIQRIDHAVGNVHHMRETLDYLKALSGFHEFAEFTTQVRISLHEAGNRDRALTIGV